MVGTLEGAVVGAVVYYGALAVAATEKGRDAAYPLRAVLAMFRGNRVLPDVGPYFHDGGWSAYIRGASWLMLMSLLCAASFLIVARYLRRLVQSPWAVVVAAVMWSLLWFAILVVVFDHPRTPALRREGMSLGGLRELGMLAFVVAHVDFGLALGLGAVRPRRQRRRRGEAAVTSSVGTW